MLANFNENTAEKLMKYSFPVSAHCIVSSRVTHKSVACYKGWNEERNLSLAIITYTSKRAHKSRNRFHYSYDAELAFLRWKEKDRFSLLCELCDVQFMSWGKQNIYLFIFLTLSLGPEEQKQQKWKSSFTLFFKIHFPSFSFSTIFNVGWNY